MFAKIKTEKDLMEWVKKEMSEGGHNIGDVAAGIGMSRSQFYRWRKGKPGMILSYNSFLGLCKHFGVDIALIREDK